MRVRSPTVTGKSPARLANAISDAINAGLKDGLEIDVAASIAVQVAADYARMAYGDTFLKDLADLVRSRAGAEPPVDIGRHTS